MARKLCRQKSFGFRPKERGILAIERIEFAREIQFPKVKLDISRRGVKNFIWLYIVSYGLLLLFLPYFYGLRSDGRSMGTYRYWKVPISIHTFFWYRYLLIDTLVFQFT